MPFSAKLDSREVQLLDGSAVGTYSLALFLIKCRPSVKGTEQKDSMESRYASVKNLWLGVNTVHWLGKTDTQLRV